MPKRALLGLATAFALTATGAQAFDIENMTEAEREAFGQAVRDYLVQNPDTLVEALEAMQAMEAEKQTRAEGQAIKQFSDKIFEDPNSWAGGNIDGDVMLVEFLDYRCQYCRKAHDEVHSLIETDGEIRYVIKELPLLGEASIAASRFAIAVLQTSGEDAYKKVSDALMTHRGQFEEPAFRRMAEDAGADADAAITQMESEEVTEVLRENFALANALAIQGTPTFVLNDRFVRGYVPLDVMAAEVDDIRAVN